MILINTLQQLNMNGKLLRQVLRQDVDKMLKGPVAGEARVQVCLPDGKYYDITSLQLMENKLIGRERITPTSLYCQSRNMEYG